MTVPPEPNTDDAPRSMFSPAFWAMMVLCLLCVVAGAAFVLFAPMLAPSKPPATATPLAPALRPAKEAPISGAPINPGRPGPP